MNSSKTTTVWVTIIIILLIIIGIVVALIYKSPSSGSGLYQNSGQNSPGTSTGTQSANTTPLSAAELENGTYSLYGDTFALANGQANITGHSFSATNTPLIPIGYTYAASGQGDIQNDLNGNPEQGSVVAMYREFGANLEWVALFAVTNNGTSGATGSETWQQIASGIVYQNDAKVQSVSVDNGVITLNLLVVSAADQNLPHYEQTLTAPLTLQFEIQNGGFVPVSNGSSANGKG